MHYLWIKISTRLWLGASKQGYSVIMFLSPGPRAFDQFLSILWRQEMIPHSTYHHLKAFRIVLNKWFSLYRFT